jgi:hypothetical protein
MTVETMEEIGLTNMSTIPIILRMVDQSRVKPLGILNQVPTTIGGIEYKVNYVIFKVTESISSYPILLGRPWLYLAKAKDDWDIGTLTTGKGSNKIVLPMYPTNYQGEIQEEESEFTSRNSYENSESTNLVNRDHFKPIGMEEYFQPLTMKTIFVKLRQNIDFETGISIITAILDVELVILKKHTKYFGVTDALLLDR